MRQGREDLLNTLNDRQLDREPGAPGEPTMQQVTEGLEGRQVDLEHDTLQPEMDGPEMDI
jgi:hypothetical protein